MNLDSTGILAAEVPGEASTSIERRCATELAPQVVDALLHALGNDDEFRALFAHDAAAALATIGHVTAPEIRGIVGVDPVMCLRADGLASKEAFRAAAGKLRTQMGVFYPFYMVE